jgi:hypothetical protein
LSMSPRVYVMILSSAAAPAAARLARLLRREDTAQPGMAEAVSTLLVVPRARAACLPRSDCTSPVTPHVPRWDAASWCSLEIGSNDILQSSTFALWILLGIAGVFPAASLLCAWLAWSASHLSVEVTREAL